MKLANLFKRIFARKPAAEQVSDDLPRHVIDALESATVFPRYGDKDEAPRWVIHIAGYSMFVFGAETTPKALQAMFNLNDAQAERSTRILKARIARRLQGLMEPLREKKNFARNW